MKFDLFKSKKPIYDKNEISKNIANSFYNNVVLEFQNMVKEECDKISKNKNIKGE